MKDHGTKGSSLAIYAAIIFSVLVAVFVSNWINNSERIDSVEKRFSDFQRLNEQIAIMRNELTNLVEKNDQVARELRGISLLVR